MIPNANNVNTVTGNLTGQKIAMRIDPAATKHLMGVLTNLYADRGLACIREYATNAFDAHIAAGNPDPIRVTLPAPLSPYLKVSDNGIGLSVDDIHDIYSQYGASTKRETNDQVGTLGLGCKAALTYAAQFTLVAIKDGVRVQVLVARSADGTNSMTVVDTATTDDPNGVEVVIPVPQHSTAEMERKARAFFAFWDPGTVLLNGKDPSGLEDAIELTPEIKVVPRQYGTNRIVMGNVAYPAKRLDHPFTYGWSVVARVPIGSVDFTPSREELMDTQVTQATLAQIEKTIIAETPKAVQRDVDAAPSRAVALKRILAWDSAMGRRSSGWKYRGKDMPTELRPTASTGQHMRMVVLPASAQKLSRHTFTAVIHADAWPSLTWITDWDRPTFTAGQKKKINAYVAENGIAVEGSYALLRPGVQPPLGWLDSARVIPWADINAIKLTRSTSATTGRIPGSYDCIIPDASDASKFEFKDGMPANDIDQTKPIFYCVGPSYNYRALHEHVLQSYPGMTSVFFPANREGKFKRLFPKAKSLTEEASALFDKWSASLSERTKQAIHMDDDWYYSQNSLRRMDPAKVNDPELSELIRIASVDLKSVNEKRRMFRNLRVRTPITPKAKPSEAAYKRYPLIDVDHPAHTYLYVNAVYAANNS